MNATSMSLGEHLRIVWAITGKDVVDAIKNKTTLSVILVILFMIAFYRVMPSLERGADLPTLRVYDAGRSSLIAALESSMQLNLRTYPSLEDTKFSLARSDTPELALAIPADFDLALASRQELELDGYVLHWVSDSDAQELKSFVEEEIAELIGQPVRIRLEGNIVYTQKRSTGYAFMAAMSVMFATIMIGIAMIPNLMLEEKKTKTIDALLVSPASSGHVVVGKAMTGLFYGLAVAAISLATNSTLITHWGLAVLAVTCGVLFAVALGLLLGSIIENRMQLNLWAWVVIFPLLVPVFLSIMDDLLPAKAIAVMNWIPTVALSRALRVSFAERAPLADFGPELALVAGCAALMLLAVTWLVRRSDR